MCIELHVFMSLGVSKMRTCSKDERMRCTVSFSNNALLFITQAQAKVKNRDLIGWLHA